MKFPVIVFLRDVVLLALCVGLWKRLDVSSLSLTVSILLSLFTTLIAFFMHEWGHWLGAVISESKLQVNNSLASFFLFKFSKSNSFGQYISMSLGGFLASIIATVVIFIGTEFDSYAGTSTRILVLLGVLVTLLVEVPELLRTLKRKKYPNGFAYTETD